jgi:hypothetical protein
MCLTYTTAPAFNDNPPKEAVNIDPVWLEIPSDGSSGTTVIYPASGLTPLAWKAMSKHSETCETKHDARKTNGATDSLNDCLKKSINKVLMPVLPKQVVVIDRDTGEFESHSVLSISPTDDPMHENYNLHTSPNKLIQDAKSTIAFGLKDVDRIAPTRHKPLTAVIGELVNGGTAGWSSSNVSLRNIPRLPGYAAPEIIIIPYPRLNQTELPSAATAPETPIQA